MVVSQGRSTLSHFNEIQFTDAEIDAAARVLDDAGRAHQWWEKSYDPYDSMDPISKSEFGGIVERMLRAAARAKD